jgi:TDG/mug DNA glycosylase family protein
MALADLHRSLAVGGVARIGLFGGDREHDGFVGDDFAGRSFSLWPEPLLRDVLVGAGFAVEALERPDPGVPPDEVPYLQVRVRAERTLADTVGPGMRLLLVGLNPSLHAADSGVGFSGPNNRGWPALLASGLATTDRDPVALLRDHRIGMTDLVKRATPRASELSAEEYRAGTDRLERLCAWLRPAAVCVLGLGGWRAAIDRRATAGEQHRGLGGRPVWVMPNPSGLNAHVDVADLAEHLRAAAELADGYRGDSIPGDET